MRSSYRRCYLKKKRKRYPGIFLSILQDFKEHLFYRKHLGDCFWKIFLLAQASSQNTSGRLLKDHAVSTLFSHNNDRETQKCKSSAMREEGKAKHQHC